tara:strand:- start:1132 stop:2487 length:1356 start_codon:yes stop_codon:yes gene_type:complete
MDSVDRLNKIFNIDTGEPKLPFLKSRKFKDIIECLKQSGLEVQYRRKTDDPDFFMDIDQEAWLRDVTEVDVPGQYEELGIPEPINWSDNRDIAFAKLNLAAAGQQLNVRKLEEDGIDDWVGQNFPAFKNNPNYHPYPKNYKMNNQKEVTSQDMEILADKFRSGEHPKSTLPLAPFFTETADGEPIPIRKLRTQVRDKDRDTDRINRAVNKIEKTGDKSGLEPLACIRYPDGVIKILNGNHTAEIGYRVGKKDIDAYIVDFDTDLGGKKSNALTLGNLLNVQEVEKVDVHENDVRKELYQMMDERAETGLHPKPPEEELVALCDRYPVSRRTVGQWISNREDVGGRRSTFISYTEGELEAQKLSLENLHKYKEYAVISPRQLRSWTDTGVEQAFKQMKNEEKKKCLVLLFCKTRAQQDQWEKTDIESRIKKEYFELGQYWNCTIEYEMLRYE